MPNIKLMLAGKCEDIESLRYPVFTSPKLDGIRATVIDGVLYSRNMKPIPNQLAQKLFGLKKYEGLDGELIVGDPTAPDVFRNTTSVVMADCQTFESLNFHVFDDWRCSAATYDDRLGDLQDRVESFWGRTIQLVSHVRVGTPALLTTLEERWLEQGYEGVMIRSPDGPYKFGRSTAREGWLLKLKRFEDGEAVIQRIEEFEHNQNEQTRDELGRAKRTSHKAGKVRGNKLGALIVQDMKTGVTFSIGGGFKEAERVELWIQGITKLYGKIVKYKYFPTGSKTKPRFPVFVGFRDRRDM